VNPLLFANWRLINKAFCIGMWLVALMLVGVILIHGQAGAGPTHSALHGVVPR
jgi:hypothetical protein